MDLFGPDLPILVTLPANQRGLTSVLLLAPETTPGVVVSGKLGMATRTGEGTMDRFPKSFRVDIGFHELMVRKCLDDPLPGRSAAFS
jgi:hypothetical protein